METSSALKHWWDDITRRTRRNVRAVSTSEGSTPVEEENTPFDLQGWEDWMNSDTEETMDSE